MNWVIFIKSIRIKNLRSLKDTNDVQIKPLTVLVGKNSSGKSSFLRFFPLLRQTLETKINEPVLWYSSRYVDFGSYEESLNREAQDNDEITFSFEFDLHSNIISFPIVSHHRLFNKGFTVDLKNKNSRLLDSSLSVSFNKQNFKQFTLTCAGQEIVVSLNSTSNKKGNTVSVSINGREINSNFSSGDTEMGNFIPQIITKLSDSKFTYAAEYFSRELFTIFKSIAHQSTLDETIEDFTQIPLGSSEFIYNALKIKNSNAKKLLANVRKIEMEDEIFKEINNNIVGMYINQLIKSVNKYLKEYFTSVKYIAPIRASAERYYRIQGISLDEVDPQGENIPMIIQNMDSSELLSFNEWLIENFNFKITSNLEGGHSSLKIRYTSGYEVNLADTGFGYSQILPVTLILWQASQVKYEEDLPFWLNDKDFGEIINIVIEQPELHLHPALQAQLIDTFIKIIELCKHQEVNISIIIETHSETIINRIGYSIAKNMSGFHKDLVNILILDNSINNYETKITTTSFTEDGFLRDWPFGFFSPEVL